MWTFKSRAPDKPYRWGVEERCERIVREALIGEKDPGMLAQISAYQNASMDALRLGCRPAPTCPRCGQFHVGLAHDSAIAGMRNALHPMAEPRADFVNSALRFLLGQ